MTIDLDTHEYGAFYVYLEALRRSGVTNMFAAPRYLKDEFGISDRQASAIFKEWRNDYVPTDYPEYIDPNQFDTLVGGGMDRESPTNEDGDEDDTTYFDEDSDEDED